MHFANNITNDNLIRRDLLSIEDEPMLSHLSCSNFWRGCSYATPYRDYIKIIWRSTWIKFRLALFLCFTIVDFEYCLKTIDFSSPITSIGNINAVCELDFFNLCGFCILSLQLNLIFLRWLWIVEWQRFIVSVLFCLNLCFYLDVSFNGPSTARCTVTDTKSDLSLFYRIHDFLITFWHFLNYQ